MKKGLIALTICSILGIGGITVFNFEIVLNFFINSTNKTENVSTIIADEKAEKNKDDSETIKKEKENKHNYKTILNNLAEGEVTNNVTDVYYTYNAPTDGRYYFELTERTADNDIYIKIYDKNQKEIKSTTNQCSVDLIKGQTYVVHIRLYSKESKYILKIGVPNEIVDINGVSSISGAIKYKYQINEYMYVANVSGRYRFELTERTADNDIRIKIKDKNEKELKYTTNNCTVDLTAGERYIIQIEYYSKLSNYKLNIGVPNNIVNISGQTNIIGEITYKDQINIYHYIPSVTGKYHIDLSERTADNDVRIRILDKNEKELKYTTNNCTIDLIEGDKYTIQTEYYSKLSKYVMTIGVPNEIVDITGLWNVSGEIRYKDQVNRYTYTPNYSGIYNFKLSDRTGDTNVKIKIRDKNEKELINRTNECKVELIAGDTYSIDIAYYSQTSLYNLSITTE